MRLLLNIPAAQRAAITRALLSLYAVKTDALGRAIDAYLTHDNPANEADRLPLLDHRRELLDIDEVLDQFEWDLHGAATEEISGERETLSGAVYGAILAALDDLNRDCHDYQRGRLDVDDLARETAQLARLIELFARTELWKGPSDS